MRTLAWLLLVVVLLVLLFGTYLATKGVASGTTIHSQGPTIESLKRLSQLASLRVTVADVLVGDNWSHRGAFLIKGDAIIAVDLEQAEFPADGKDFANRRIRIVLPAPRVLTARVDHQRTKTWNVNQKIWVVSPIFGVGNADRVRDDAMRQGQELVEQAAASKENIDMARTHAAVAIQSLYRELDWQVEVAWMDQKPASVPPSKAK